ncbi:MAG: cytochrome c [Chloroflexi bacterium]|nr:cytochrome c [Chloroflexota bacterium]
MNARRHTQFSFLSPLTGKFWLLALMLSVIMLAGCTEIGNMQEQPKHQKPYDESETFGAAAQDLDPNAIPVGFLREDAHLYTGRVGGELVDTFPMELTEDMILEGKRLYEGFCAPCHGYSGYGDGVVAKEGFREPASYHSDQLRAQPVGHFYEVITNGQGTMYSYASRIAPEDRWAIVAYIRTLQLSQHASLEALPDDIKADFGSSDAATDALSEMSGSLGETDE